MPPSSELPGETLGRYRLESFQRIVRKCLAKDPDERYQSAKDLAIDLRSLKREGESQPQGIATVAAPKRRAELWIGAARSVRRNGTTTATTTTSAIAIAGSSPATPC